MSKASARTSHFAVAVPEFRLKTTDELISLFKQKLADQPDSHLNIDLLVNEIEETIYLHGIRTMVTESEAVLSNVYQNFASNLLYNLNQNDQLLTRLISHQEATLNAILSNGPLELNRELPEIQDLLRQEEKDATERVRVVPNVSHVRCPSCRCTEVNMQLVQTRGGDEGTSRFFTCCNKECGREWRRG